MSFGFENTIGCDHEIIYDENSARRETFGVVTHIDIAGAVIKSEWKPKLPHTNKPSEENVLMVLTSFSWDAGRENGVRIQGYCPTSVRAEILKHLTGGMKDSAIEISFEIYKYNPTKAAAKGGEGGYYMSRQSKGLKGYIPLDGENKLCLRSDPEEKSEPNRCRTVILVMPAPGHESHIHMSDEEGQVIVKAMGASK